MLTGKNDNFLIGSSKENDLIELYKEMIKYAKTNNYQIRGWFTEVYDNEKITIYVEAYDLNEKNNDLIRYIYNFNKKEIKFELDEDLIGIYEIRDILPSMKYMFNPKRVKSLLDTNFKRLELKNDGTTNYDYIKWTRGKLLLKYNDNVVPLLIYSEIIAGKRYYEILMNESYNNYLMERPLSYIYEKID